MAMWCQVLSRVLGIMFYKKEYWFSQIMNSRWGEVPCLWRRKDSEFLFVKRRPLKVIGFMEFYPSTHNLFEILIDKGKYFNKLNYDIENGFYWKL